MPTKKKIITFTVLGLIAMGLGYWYGMPEEDSGGGGKNGGGKKESEFLKKGLVAYYPFNGNAKDESGNGNDGEIIGATLCTNRFGKADSAFAFDSKDFVRVNNSFGKSLTIASWGLLPKNPSRGSMLWHFGSNPPVNLHFFNGKIFLNTHDGQDNPFATYTAKTNTWTHYVTVISPDQTELFIDGEKLGQAQYRQPSGKPFFIGMNGAHPWIGQIDDIRIYNRALSEAEVKELYELEKPKTQQASTPTSTKVVPSNLITDPIVEKAIRERRRKPTGELTKADLEQVVYLDLTSTKITDASLKEVAKLTQLKSLYLNDTKITDVGLREVAEMKQLTSLYFKDTQITDVSLKEVTKMKQLTSLYLRATKVTKAVVRQLQKALPKCKIYSNAKK